VRVKICGITLPADAAHAERAGADAIGLNFVPASRRRVTLEQAEAVCAAVGPLVVRVGVFVDAPLDEVWHAVERLRLGAVQLHGEEPPAYAAALRERVPVVRALPFRPGLTPGSLAAYPADAILLDAPRAGSGRPFRWGDAGAWRGHPRLVLAGGLTPETVAGGIEALAPYGVDVASGVERSPGVKDHERVEAFVRAARGA
jgi:phosphoribosylanthranilate isomerase